MRVFCENRVRYREALADFDAASALVPTDPASYEAMALTHVHLEVTRNCTPSVLLSIGHELVTYHAFAVIR